MSCSNKQVNASHYDFPRYMVKRRWASLWHQVDEIIKCQPKTVLEIGKGSGLLGVLLKHYGIDYQSVDVDPELKPDYVAPIINLPVADDSFDVVGCFQILEHMPYSDFQKAISEIARVSKRYVIISLPDAKRLWVYSFDLPKIGRVSLKIPKPTLRPKHHVFDGQHHWEINRAGYSLRKVTQDIEDNGLKVDKTYRVVEHTYHRFFKCRVA